MRVFPLLAVFVFSTIGISALAIDDNVDVATTIENNEGSAPIIFDEVSGDLYSDISMDESLNTEDKDEDGEEEKGTDTKDGLSDMFAELDAQNTKEDDEGKGDDEEDSKGKDKFSNLSAELDAQNTEEKDGKGEGDDEEDSKGKDKFSNLFAELNVQNAKGEQAEGDQAETQAAPQQQPAPQVEVSEPVAEDKPSRWSLYLEFWEEDKFGPEGALETYATIRPQYQLTDKLRIGYSFEFTVDWGVLGPDDAETNAIMGNHYLMFSTSTALGPFDLFGYVRIYLPTSESWSQIGQIARVRIKPYLTLPISRDVKLAFRLETNYFQHTVDSYRSLGTNTIGDNYTCNSARYCSDINEQWRIEPMLGFLGKIYGPFSFESIHGFRFHNRFQNNTIDTENQKQKPKHEVMWYNESGITWDVNVGGVPVTLLAGFYDHRKTGGAFWKRLPIVSYFTGPINESWWVFSIWASI